MRSMGVSLVIVLALAGILSADGALSQEAEQPMSAEEQAMETAWTKAAAPGEFHKYFEGLKGDWQMTGKSWMSPQMEAVEWGGTSKKTILFEGRFMREDVQSEMLGQVFLGVGILGYSNITQKYWHIWFDNMSTGLTLSEGGYDPKGKVFTLVGEFDDPMTGGRTKVRTVLTVQGADKHLFETYQINPDGSEFKSMEVTYTRAQ